MEVDLSKKENWTPQLTYIHRSRLLIGLILGFILGIDFSCLVFYLVIK